MRPSISIATKLRHYSFLKNAFGIDIGNDDACLNRKGSQELIGSSNVAAYCGIIKSISVKGSLETIVSFGGFQPLS